MQQVMASVNLWMVAPTAELPVGPNRLLALRLDTAEQPAEQAVGQHCDATGLGLLPLPKMLWLVLLLPQWKLPRDVEWLRRLGIVRSE